MTGRWPTEAAGRRPWPARGSPSTSRRLTASSARRAERTRQTLVATGLDAPVSYLEAIYGADPDELLDVLRDVDRDEVTVLLVGHAPGLPDLAEELAGSGSDLAALDRLRAGFPTSALAVLAITGDWWAIGPGRGALAEYVIAR